MIAVLERAIGWAALHTLWQGALLGLAAWLLLQQSDDADTRYRAVCTSLAISVALFGLNAALYLWPTTHVNSSIAPTIRPMVQRTLFAAPDVLRWVGVAWITGVVLVLTRYAGGWMLAHRSYVRSARSARGEWRQRAAVIAQRRGLSLPLVLESTAVDSPAVFGVWRSALVLPVEGMDLLDDIQLDGILAHELMHIERRDGLANALQCIGDAILFFHPVARHLSRIARAEREHICDARAVEMCGNSRSYVSALLLLEETRCYAGQFVLSARAGSLVRRVRALVRTEPQTHPSWFHTTARAGAALIGLFVLAITFAFQPTLRVVVSEVSNVLHYTVTAADPAGDFTLRVERGRATAATLSGHAVASRQILQHGDSVFILDDRGSTALALHVRSNGGITWTPRRAPSSL